MNLNFVIQVNGAKLVVFISRMNTLLRRAISSAPLMSRQGIRLLSAEAGKPDFDNLVKKNKVVVFMKGVPDAPKCGFSNAVVQIMRMHGVNFDSYDVLDDEHIRQGRCLSRFYYT